ncbi:MULTISPECIES: hypothetical protein [Actinomadura]|uniref:Uncharacterized protein n=1 Tax=Actinomadura madurae TaxID=1993 RepID=A0A1I4WIA2_9ACTN|nr:hypothetical protein [Actinomadura madurae]SFN13408.1 hypothetical protein SAMN04489713_101358 [Actinomadura madurae]SPT63114.1 Uncharacterised protein [Actinomadura madurae]
MSNSYQPHRSHRRRRKSHSGRLGLAGALTGAVGIAAVAGAIVYLRPGTGERESTEPALASQGGAGRQGTSVPAPKAGPPVNFTTPEGYGYSLAAVKAGTNRQPLGATEAPPSGTTYAYADYILTNNQRRPVLLDYPADLFMPKAQVPEDAQERCMPQAGIAADMCTLPNHSKITGLIDGSKAPVDDNGTAMMPAGASYVVRIASDLPVKEGLSADDLQVYVWNARYTSDRKGIRLAFP